MKMFLVALLIIACTSSAQAQTKADLQRQIDDAEFQVKSLGTLIAINQERVQTIYQQLADILVGQLIDGDPPEGDAMPSVRVLANRYLLNPLTVNRALQCLGDDGLLENRRGLGLYVTAGARARLRAVCRSVCRSALLLRTAGVRG